MYNSKNVQKLFEISNGLDFIKISAGYIILNIYFIRVD